MSYQEELAAFLEKVKKDFSFDSSAARVLDPLGYIPYVAYMGLTPSFVEDEEIITINECICGKVTRLDVQKNNTHFFTKWGSFWSNYMGEGVAEELKKIGVEPRGRCLREGYKTLLVIPVHAGNGNRGSLFFASKKENLLKNEDVEFLEDAAGRFGRNAFEHLTECDRYSLKACWLAQNNGDDGVIFGKYFEHVKNCRTCYELYRFNLEFDNTCKKVMAQGAASQELKSRIIEHIRPTNGDGTIT